LFNTILKRERFDSIYTIGSYLYTSNFIR
jgi:hypothetical protein